MAKPRPATVAEYIAGAAPVAQPHLEQLYAVLKRIAPDATEVIKWGSPFFVEPRFLFAFSAHKAHLSFAPTAEALDLFRAETSPYQTTQHFLQIAYQQVLPEELIERMAWHRVKVVSERTDDRFW